MTCPAAQLANKIEVHLKLDETPGYYLSTEDQQMIVDCLRFTSRCNLASIERTIVDYVDAAGGETFQRDAEWMMDGEAEISLTALALAVEQGLAMPAIPNGDGNHG
ncbi:hypothetical protein JQ633_31975 [Bradyrhizobium tropiciagri]|uniref:hypothetical protein n=1 Tax=Bradyrhizobium tropiciagri TaxID=312253 RepID=UPI001BA7FA89|nr:hypothetical protein [Bradyrhizobium tropiciagri]MBR0875015.1 hypothetical protein [Bradyrhizobium tropiciagri]